MKSKKPLFDVKLQIWENWSHFWDSLPWYVKKFSGYSDIGKKRIVAGAFDPSTKSVHLFLDEIARDALVRLEKCNSFNKRNYDMGLVTRLFCTLVHELTHSLPICDSPADHDAHRLSKSKVDKLLVKSMWYGEFLRLLRVMDAQVFDVMDSNTEGESFEDHSE